MFSKKRKRALIRLSLFSPKIKVFSKKKGLHLESILYPTFRPDFIIPKKICSEMKLYVLFRGGSEATALFASPNIHHWAEPTQKRTKSLINKIDTKLFVVAPVSVGLSFCCYITSPKIASEFIMLMQQYCGICYPN